MSREIKKVDSTTVELVETNIAKQKMSKDDLKLYKIQLEKEIEELEAKLVDLKALMSEINTVLKELT